MVDPNTEELPEANSISAANPAIIFISHRTEDEKIAVTIKTALERLSYKMLQVQISEKMGGAETWRNWIKEKTSQAKVLIFLHTDEEADLQWCIYEIGLFRGKPRTSGRKRTFCIIDPDIEFPPDPIADLQANKADIAGIGALFKALIGEPDIFGVRLNHELLGNDKEEFDRYVRLVVRQFTPLVKTKQIVQLLTVTLARASSRELSEANGEDIVQLDREDAEIGGKDALRLLRLPEGGCSWGQMYAEFKKRGEIAWLDDLAKRIEDMRTSGPGDGPAIALPRLELDGNFLNPFISRYEMFQLRRRDAAAQDVLKTLFVAFVPVPKGLHDIRGLFDNHFIDLFAPASVVQINWKKRSHEFEYDVTDMDGPPIVCELNPEFARLFDIKANPRGIVGGAVLTAGQLFGFIEDYVEPGHMEALKRDQERLANRIILKFRDDRATVSLQFNGNHPHFPNKVYLPYVISKQQVGDPSGPHQTLFFICYIEDFVPIG